MLINDSCDLSYTLAKSFDFQLAGKNSDFLNSCTETENRKQGGFVAIETHGKPPALVIEVPISSFQYPKLSIV